MARPVSSYATRTRASSLGVRARPLAMSASLPFVEQVDESNRVELALLHEAPMPVGVVLRGPRPDNQTGRLLPARSRAWSIPRRRVVARGRTLCLESRSSQAAHPLDRRSAAKGLSVFDRTKAHDASQEGSSSKGMGALRRRGDAIFERRIGCQSAGWHFADAPIATHGHGFSPFGSKSNASSSICASA